MLSTTELWNLFEHLAKSKSGESSSTEESASHSTNSTAKSTAGELILGTIPDPPSGRDSIESMLRCFGANGRRVRSVSQLGDSGGFLDYIIRSAASQLSGSECGDALPYQVGRNVDYVEVNVAGENGSNVRGAKAYGFRNIQGVVQKHRRGRLELDLIEVMACPGGCLNGGGQIKGVAETPAAGRDRLATLSAMHEALEVRPPESSPLVQLLYEGDMFNISPRYRSYVRTRYHAVPKLENVAPLAAKW